MKHFEQLWEDAEKASAKSPLSKEVILANLRKLLEVYLDLESDKISNTEYIISAKEKALGDILYMLSNLSKIDSIDVYTALIKAIQRVNIKLLSQNKTSDSDL